MRFLKHIFDQIFTARRLTNKFCNDESFVKIVGLKDLSKFQRRLQLFPRVGFVLAMYNTAKAIFYNGNSEDTDLNLVNLMISRFRLLPHIQNTHELALRYFSEISSSNPDWKQLCLKKKFFIVCSRVFAEEEKTNAILPIYTDNEFIEMISFGVIHEILNAVFEEIEWDIQERA